MSSYKTEDRRMKASTKIIIMGVLSILTIVGSGELFDMLGVVFGPTEAGLTAIAGAIGSFKLLSGA